MNVPLGPGGEVTVSAEGTGEPSCPYVVEGSRP